jgi:hypothetical protein
MGKGFYGYRSGEPQGKRALVGGTRVALYLGASGDRIYP